MLPIPMNRRHMIRTMALTLVGATFFLQGTDCATAQQIAPQEISAKPGTTKAIAVGETLRHDSGLKVTFLAVKDDSRCPINAICTSQGDAEILVRVKAGNQPARNYRLHTARKPNHLVIPANVYPPGHAGIPKSYVIKIGELSPLPWAGKKTKQSAYRLKLDIKTAF